MLLARSASPMHPFEDSRLLALDVHANPCLSTEETAVDLLASDLPASPSAGLRNTFLRLFPSFENEMKDANAAVLMDDTQHAAGSDSSSIELEPYQSVFANCEEHALGPEHLAPYQQQQQQQEESKLNLQSLHAPPGSTYTSPLHSTVLHAPSSLRRTWSFDRPQPESPFKSDRLQHAISHPVIMVRANSSNSSPTEFHPSMPNLQEHATRRCNVPDHHMEAVQASVLQGYHGRQAQVAGPGPSSYSKAAMDSTETQRAPASRSRSGNPPKTPRSSKYRGVTKHRRSGRWEAHIWVKDLGRQVYLGGYEHEDHAAEAHDVAALKCKGRRVKTNFSIQRYTDLIQVMDSISLDELIMTVRRQSQGFSRGSSSYRGVTRHPSGRWEARVGVPGSKHVYLGLYDSEGEAAKAYDSSLVRLRGSSAATNFALSEYRLDLAAYHKLHQEILGAEVDATRLLEQGSAFEAWLRAGITAQGQLSSARGRNKERQATPTEQEVVQAASAPPPQRQSNRLTGRPSVAPVRRTAKHGTDSDEDWHE